MDVFWGENHELARKNGTLSRRGCVVLGPNDYTKASKNECAPTLFPRSNLLGIPGYVPALSVGETLSRQSLQLLVRPSQGNMFRSKGCTAEKKNPVRTSKWFGFYDDVHVNRFEMTTNSYRRGLLVFHRMELHCD